MKGRVSEIPQAFRPAYERMRQRAQQICGRVVELNAESVACGMRSFFDHLPADSGTLGEIERGRVFGALAIAYADALVAAFGWQPCWLLLEEKDYREEDGVFAVVSPDQSYVVLPVALIESDFDHIRDNAKAVFKKIRDGHLLDVPEGALHELRG
ncbi:hypothetical protein [Sulfuriroseicoccus oceanibius]|uniref:DUF3806 domain-containing protein n=1 Tax=Sulfuriroseicoccus oceanibius TaxID=2707525 RepID=A0A6B3L4B4_9BACT|nr:hypothetical protein [Sulfuriroseicoccus oceanibius]QQL45560.1 hypothetical protein G3M56_002940 [Sulfuriroseicoccus oceanibius]